MNRVSFRGANLLLIDWLLLKGGRTSDQTIGATTDAATLEALQKGFRIP